MTDFNTLALGVDMYHGQGTVDFAKMKAAGVEFVIPKVSQGTYLDPMFKTYIDGARAVGIVVPAAYVWVTVNDTMEFVQDFLNQITGMDVAAALDVETQVDASLKAAYATVVDEYIDACEQKLGRMGFRYTGKWPVDDLSAKQRAWPQWLAGYHDLAEGPSIPFWDGTSGVSDWTTRVAIWQYNGSGRVDGCDTEIDLNRSAVSADRLAKFATTGVF